MQLFQFAGFEESPRFRFNPSFSLVVSCKFSHAHRLPYLKQERKWRNLPAEIEIFNCHFYDCFLNGNIVKARNKSLTLQTISDLRLIIGFVTGWIIGKTFGSHSLLCSRCLCGSSSMLRWNATSASTGVRPWKPVTNWSRPEMLCRHKGRVQKLRYHGYTPALGFCCICHITATSSSVL